MLWWCKSAFTRARGSSLLHIHRRTEALACSRCSGRRRQRAAVREAVRAAPPLVAVHPTSFEGKGAQKNQSTPLNKKAGASDERSAACRPQALRPQLCGRAPAAPPLRRSGADRGRLRPPVRGVPQPARQPLPQSVCAIISIPGGLSDGQPHLGLKHPLRGHAAGCLQSASCVAASRVRAAVATRRPARTARGSLIARKEGRPP